jgi:hypothetical protein
MPAKPDPDYFQMRAEQELTLAERATDPAICHVRYQLAELYLERAYPPETGSVHFERQRNLTPANAAPCSGTR